MFSPEDVSRVRLALALEVAGVPLERLAAAAAQGLLSLEVTSTDSTGRSSICRSTRSMLLAVT